FRVSFTVDGRGAVTSVTLRPGEPRERRAPRVAPLPGPRHPPADPDKPLATRIVAALAALRQGGPALASSPDVTAGAKKDFVSGANPALGGASTAEYLGQHDVAGRGIRRHGGEVARVRLYRMQSETGTRYLLVHLTDAGTITD